MKTREEIEKKIRELRGVKAAVLGLGVSNIPVVRFLIGLGATVTACDRKDKEALGSTYDELEALGASFQLGQNYLNNLDRFDLIVKTPGMRSDLVEIQSAIDAGARITSEIELVFDLCPCKIIGITGSDGKTTTTSLVAAIMAAEGLDVHLGGNIGTPLVDSVLDYDVNDIVVLELSSFQLMPMNQSPEFSLVTNISPNHLDVHKSYQEYIEAKRNIFKFQDKNDVIVLNWDNEETRKAAQFAKSNVWFFSRKEQIDQGAVLWDSRIVIIDGNVSVPICNISDIQLLGEHNVENVLSAALTAYLAGASPEAIKAAITSFTGVEHRLEKVRELDGVSFYNDSIASSPTRTIAGIRSFDKPIILIAGGYDKKIPFGGFAEEVVKEVKALVVMGDTSVKILSAIERKMREIGRVIPISKVSSLEEAVNKATEYADEGDVVLLSPACASFDMFSNFVERGRTFKKYVMAL